MLHKRQQKIIKQNGEEQKGTCIFDTKTTSAYLRNMKTRRNKSKTIDLSTCDYEKLKLKK